MGPKEIWCCRGVSSPYTSPSPSPACPFNTNDHPLVPFEPFEGHAAITETKKKQRKTTIQRSHTGQLVITGSYTVQWSGDVGVSRFVPNPQPRENPICGLTGWFVPESSIVWDLKLHLFFFLLICLGYLGYLGCSGQRLYNDVLKRYLIIPRLD